MSIARAYDAAAKDYDATLAQNPVALWMREQLWAHYARVIPTDARVLDFTAGTGADALFLARRGARVTACDVSQGMLEELQERARAASLQIEMRVLAAETLDQLAAPQFDASQFDAAISGFAGINTIQDMPQLAQNLARALKPRGRVILHGLGAFCFWETANQIAHRHTPKPRSTQTRVGDEMIALRLYNPFKLYRSAFAPHFTLREMYALSVITAPTWVQRARGFAPILFKLDRALGRVFPTAGDFFVMDLEKRP